MHHAFPKKLALKQRKCPECRAPIDGASLIVVDAAVQATCATHACGHRIDLIWLGIPAPAKN